MDDIISTLKEPKKYLLGKCELNAKVEKDKITIELAAQDCKLDLKELVDHFYPNNKLAEETKNFLIAEMLFMKIEIDKSEKIIKFEAKAPKKLDLIKNKLSISDSSVEILFKYQKNLNYENIGVKMSGKVALGKQPIDVVFEKKEGENAFMFKAVSKNVEVKLTVKDVAELIGAEEITKEMFGEEALKKKIFDFKMESIGFEGIFDPSKMDLELVVSGEVKNHPVAKKINAYIVITKISGEPYKVGIAAKFESVEFQKLVELIVGKENDINFLKGKTLNAILLAANKDITLVQNKEIISLIKETPIKENAAFPAGVTVSLKVSIQKDKENDSKSKSADMHLYLRYNHEAKKFEFKFIPAFETKLVDAMDLFAKKTMNAELPQWLGKLEAAIKFQKFSFGFDGSLTLDVFIPADLKIGSILKINDVKMGIVRSSASSGWEFNLESTTMISKDVSITISIKKSKNGYELEGTINSISIKRLLDYLVSDNKFVTGDFEKFNLNLLNVKLKWMLVENKASSLR